MTWWGPLSFSTFYYFPHYLSRTRLRSAEATGKMTDIPYRTLTGLSALSAYSLVTYLPGVLPSAQPGYLGTFAQLWTLGFTLFAFWQIIVYPKLLSPLRHLPGPKGGSWWNGQFFRILAEPTGAPMREWQVFRINAQEIGMLI